MSNTNGQDVSEPGNLREQYSNQLPAIDDFSKKTPEEIEQYLNRIFSDYDSILLDFFNSAESSAKEHAKFQKKGRQWRFWLIWMTGLVAIINTAAALNLFAKVHFTSLPPLPQIAADQAQAASQHVTLAAVLTVMAALLAVVATVLGNVENFLGYADKAARKREAREIYYNAYWSHRSKWQYFVTAHGKSPKACANASVLYSELITSLVGIRQDVQSLLSGRESTSISASMNEG